MPRIKGCGGYWNGSDRVGPIDFEKYCAEGGIEFSDPLAAVYYAEYLESISGQAHQVE